MYCERCGKQIDNALNFCNACGAQLKKEKSEQQSALNMLITALIVVCTAGLGVLVGLMAILLNKIQTPEPAFIFAIFYLATLFGISFLIMRQISKLIDAKLIGKDKSDSHQVRREEPLVQLPPKTTNQLEDFREPASVIENTTRTLDEVRARRG
ncbi:MAG: zinc ribbon domain-containing protein [bacterium]|nr:zinc ribbon domain-containing protein [bacterium]